MIIRIGIKCLCVLVFFLEVLYVWFSFYNNLMGLLLLLFLFFSWGI